ncbi:MAG: hypothetical protein A3K19_28640 [Lentisphaerae bacterium RIFOXYB12_FULL_65_16]|nr:MAG: hypothetical protein A3K18_28340 [Lentisphaerae bacterium RIFOXYA12_64_32]OGV92747.1 MAG: hypothetical protein A3K19_28640 [Lentisphaerae bacterium RIFOXYB12_FULL_65_16]
MTRRTVSLDRYTLAGLAAILLWSTSVAVVRSLTEKLGPYTAGAAVYLTAGVLFLAQLLGQARGIDSLRRLSRPYLFGCGALFVSYMIALYVAIGLAADRHQVLEIGLVNYLWPTLTILFSLLLLRQRAGLLLVPGTLLALAGVFLVLTQGQSVSWSSFTANVASRPVAYALALYAAVSWGLYSNLTRRWAGPESGSGVAVFVAATGLALLCLRLGTTEPTHWTARGVAEVAFLGGATALGYALWDLAMRKGDVVFVAACSYLTPLLSTLVACCYLRIMPGTSLAIGCLLIIAGSFLSWRSVAECPGPRSAASGKALSVAILEGSAKLGMETEDRTGRRDEDERRRVRDKELETKS